jgi:hypothetical protein
MYKTLGKEDEGCKPFTIPLPKDKLPYHEQDLALAKSFELGRPRKFRGRFIPALSVPEKPRPRKAFKARAGSHDHPAVRRPRCPREVLGVSG